MSEVIYREIGQNDYEKRVDLIDETWEFSRYISNPKSLRRGIRCIFLSSLLTSSYGKVAVVDGEVVGFILGNVKKQRKLPHKPFISFNIIADLVRILLASKDDRRVFSEYIKVPKAYRELLQGKSFCGEVVFLAVSVKHKGLSIGKNLTNQLKDYYREVGADVISVFTDTDCNYGFYDSQGFKLIGEKEIELDIKPNSKKLTIFLYEFRI